MLLEASQRLAAHAALAHHHADAVLADEVGLVGLFADARGGSGGRDFPRAVGLLGHHRAAVINHAAIQVDRRRVTGEVMMHGIASRVGRTADQHDVADLERPDGRFINRRAQHDLAAGAPEAGLVHHRDRLDRRVAIDPFLDGAGRAVERDTQPAIGPAVVRHRHEEAGRQAVLRANLAANQ